MILSRRYARRRGTCVVEASVIYPVTFLILLALNQAGGATHFVSHYFASVGSPDENGPIERTDDALVVLAKVDWHATPKHLATLRQCYAKSPYFQDYIGLFDAIYARTWTTLFDLNMELFGAVTQAPRPA